MLERSSSRRALEKNLKRLRRFAVSLSGNQSTADIAVMDAVKSQKSHLAQEHNPSEILTLLLRAVYRQMDTEQSRPRSISLLKPFGSEAANIYVRFQSLRYTEKAVMSLFLIEGLPPEKIARITQMPLSAVDRTILKNVEFLSDREKMGCATA